jgi:hypothetical protein
VQSRGVLSALRGHLEVPDTDEFIRWLLEAVPVPAAAAPAQPAVSMTPIPKPLPPAPAPTPMFQGDMIEQLADIVAAKLRPVYAPAAPSMPAPASMVDMNRLSPLQRAMVNAMLQGR